MIFVDTLEKTFQFLQDEGIEAKRHIELKQYTTLHIEGEAQILAEPSSIAQIQQCMAVCRRYGIDWFLLGNGSNVLAMDEGFDGMVIVLSTNFHSIELEDATHVRAQSGAAIKAVSAFCAAHSLSGLEFACGIPGSVGGAVYMNAGAYGGETKDVLIEAVWMDVHGALYTSSAQELELRYRHSRFSEHGGIVLEAVYELKQGVREDIVERMEELMRRRREKQPLDAYSAGSTFKRPPGNYASALIRDAGLMGLQVRDAQVSMKHAGFLINRRDASSQDFLELIHRVQQEVRQHSGYELECEIRFLKNQH